jgi:hypothetical protein
MAKITGKTGQTLFGLTDFSVLFCNEHYSMDFLIIFSTGSRQNRQKIPSPKTGLGNFPGAQIRNPHRRGYPPFSFQKCQSGCFQLVTWFTFVQNKPEKWKNKKWLSFCKQFLFFSPYLLFLSNPV